MSYGPGFKFILGDSVVLETGEEGVVEGGWTDGKYFWYSVETEAGLLDCLENVLSIKPPEKSPEPKPKYQAGDVVRSDTYCANYIITGVEGDEYITFVEFDDGELIPYHKFKTSFLDPLTLMAGPTLDAQKAREEHYSATTPTELVWKEILDNAERAVASESKALWEMSSGRAMELKEMWGGGNLPPPPEPTEYIPTWSSEKWSEPTTCEYNNRALLNTNIKALESRFDAAADAMIKEYKGTLRETPFCAYSQQYVELKAIRSDMFRPILGHIDPPAEEKTIYGHAVFHCPACHDDKEE